MTDFFKTTDLNMSATIVAALGIQPDHLDRKNSKVIFAFKRSNKLEKLLMKYWRKELQVEPIAFSMAQKYLKNQIHHR